MSLKNKHIIVFDRAGLYTYFAQKLGELAAQVKYYIPDTDAYPCSATDEIGRNLPEIQRITSKEFYKGIDECDLIAFPDCYDGSFQHWLRDHGYCVFGSGESERFEIDKAYCLESLYKAGCNIAPTYRAEGLKDLVDYLKKKSAPLWLKGMHRGDFETKKHTGMLQTQNWIEQYLIPKIGHKRDTIEILIQNDISGDCEPGIDRFVVNGKFTAEGLIGYEDKDKGLIAKFFSTLPKILTDIDDKTSVYLRDARSHYSTEVRINKGRPYLIDPTCRIPSPPGELMTEMFTNYGEIIWDVANGEIPKLIPKTLYGVEIILSSSFNECHEICVEFDKSLLGNIKLKNHTAKRGAYYCIPNGNCGSFGAVVACSNNMQKAIDQAKDIIKEIKCEEMDCDLGTFDKAKKSIENGKKYGILF